MENMARAFVVAHGEDGRVMVWWSAIRNGTREGENEHTTPARHRLYCEDRTHDGCKGEMNDQAAAVPWIRPSVLAQLPIDGISSHSLDAASPPATPHPWPI